MQSSGDDGHGVLVNALAACRPSWSARPWPAGPRRPPRRSEPNGRMVGMRADISAAGCTGCTCQQSQLGHGDGTRRASRKRQRPARTGRRRESTNAETGRLSPSMRVDGVHDVADLLDQSRGRPVEMLDLGACPSASAQSAGTSIFTYAVAPQVDGLVVHVNDFLALLQVGARGGVLHVARRRPRPAGCSPA